MRLRSTSAMVATACCGIALASSSRADVITDWNTILLDSVRAEKTPPPMASRAMAMVHASMYDAVNGIAGTHTPYVYANPAPAGTNKTAAAAVAAHRTLVSLYPSRQAQFDAALADTLNAISDGPAKSQGIAYGEACANACIVARSNDNSTLVVPYVPGDQPGDWRPTPPGFGNALLPNWPLVTPFAMNSGDQFRRSGPPDMSSQAYADAYNEVKKFGARNSTDRTEDQTQIARFWADGSGTETPPGHWNSITADVSVQQGLSVEDNARLFALLNIALADAAIVSWDMKYEYNFWRPVTAIREGDTDFNPDTAADPDWEPLIVTPPFPEYTSGHSTFSGAAALLLAQFFGTDSVAFTTGSDALPGVFRDFSSFSQASEEAGLSRIFGGIHFDFSNLDGRLSGQDLSRYVFANFMLPVPAPTSGALACAACAVLASRRRR